MKISTEKRDFLKCISSGLAVLVDCSMLSEEIYVTQEDEIEVFIKNNLLDGSSFSEEKFDALMDTIDDSTLEELYNSSTIGSWDYTTPTTKVASPEVTRILLLVSNK